MAKKYKRLSKRSPYNHMRTIGHGGVELAGGLCEDSFVFLLPNSQFNFTHVAAECPQC